MTYSDRFTFHGYFLHLLLVNINLTSDSNSNTIDKGNVELVTFGHFGVKHIMTARGSIFDIVEK